MPVARHSSAIRQQSRHKVQVTIGMALFRHCMLGLSASATQVGACALRLSWPLQKQRSMLTILSVLKPTDSPQYTSSRQFYIHNVTIRHKCWRKFAYCFRFEAHTIGLLKWRRFAWRIGTRRQVHTVENFWNLISPELANTKYRRGKK